jgi:hypothetical protein
MYMLNTVSKTNAKLSKMLIFNFIKFGTKGSLKNFITSIKIKTENMMYSKYINLFEKIEINKQELSKI